MTTHILHIDKCFGRGTKPLISIYYSLVCPYYLMAACYGEIIILVHSDQIIKLRNKAIRIINNVPYKIT